MKMNFFNKIKKAFQQNYKKQMYEYVNNHLKHEIEIALFSI